ncbi:PBECR2 nuclease fold domain-containing protein [Pseudomonas sp. RIT-PI-q]|uniref:PBECR2 nuclease fold domain-containing protein n=1 Tax=Pseudomonas sp. RIT-PI-q TaxID=1690247 RepID=UPI001F34B3CD|nr:PBECR2 nuclease fold domain-containing protein [Pseudomonas sp. RIT-PI-q]
MTLQLAEIAVDAERDFPMCVPKVKEAPDQENWKDLGLPDLRDISVTLSTPALRELPGAADFHSAVEQVALGFGLQQGIDAVLIETPYVPITIWRHHLFHIVEKRPNARERFTDFAVDTLRNPLEIWRVSYSDGSHRLAFIGLYNTKYQMLVVIHVDHGNLLWNFMNCEKKALNKHRHGELVYQRCLGPKQKKQP